MTEKFNEFFTTVGSNLASELPSSDIDPLSYLVKIEDKASSFKFFEISDDIFTSGIIQNCLSKNAVGCDQISMKVLKDHSKTLVPILTHLTIKTSTFPDSQKIARVGQIHKKGDKAELNNYRPISILTATSKIVEKVLSFQL